MKELARTWLALHGRLVPGVSAAVVYLGSAERGPYAAAARFPEDAPEPASLTAAAQDALLDRCAVVRAPRDLAEGAAGRDAVALPLMFDGALLGAVAVEVPHRPKTEQQPVIEALRVGAGWLEFVARERASAGSGSAARVLELLAHTLEAGDFRASATALATALAARLGLARASLGFAEGDRVRLVGLSHSAEFSAQAEIVRQAEAAMEEAVDQRARVSFPPCGGDEPRIRRAHEALSRQLGDAALCTLPVVDGERVVGALCLEGAARHPLREEAIALCEQVLALAGPLLEARRRSERALRVRLRERSQELAAEWMGPGHTLAKTLAAATAALLLLLAIVPAQHRVAADATLEGTTRRVVAAAVDGFLVEEHVRPGDLVSEGQVLAALDDRDLALERLEWKGELQEAEAQYREALALRDWTQVSVLSARTAQARARLDLVEEQLARTKLVAPFDGVVVKGDLAQSLGSPVERGEVVFEITPLDSYRIILEVDERDVGRVAVGQQGRLALSSLPGERLPLVVQRITPIASAADGSNHFRVEAHLADPPALLRPGMEGVAKIATGRRSLLWILGHDLLDRLRLFLWTWLP